MSLYNNVKSVLRFKALAILWLNNSNVVFMYKFIIYSVRKFMYSYKSFDYVINRIVYNCSIFLCNPSKLGYWTQIVLNYLKQFLKFCFIYIRYPKFKNCPVVSDFFKFSRIIWGVICNLYRNFNQFWQFFSNICGTLKFCRLLIFL